MHPKDEMLRAFSDREMSASQTLLVREHLTRCAECQARLEAMNRRASRVQNHLDYLAPTALEQPHSAQAAYKRFAGNSRRSTNQKETTKHMSTKRSLWVTLSVLTVLALVFTITPARAWASDLLGLFRVEKVQVITFDPSMAENAADRLNENQEAVEQIFKDDLQVTEHGSRFEVASVDEAAEKAGFRPRVPAGMEGAKISVQPGMNAIFTIDQPKLQAVMDAVGVDAQLPESVNGKVVTADVGDAVVISSNCEGDGEKGGQPDGCVEFFQVYSPQVNAPDDLDVPAMGAAMFQFLGLSADEASALSQRIDWATTLVLPIPQDGQVQYEDVQVDGVTGTLLETDGSAMLVWVKDGLLYSLRAPAGSATDVVTLAGTLQ